MTITIKNATPEDQKTVELLLNKLRAEHQKGLDDCNAAMRAINACEKSTATEQALEAMREARRPHLDALRILKAATVRYE